MSIIARRFTPPDESYDGFKFRLARTLAMVFGFFVAVFFVKHVLIFHSVRAVSVLPEPFRVITDYLLEYYWRTLGGAIEMVSILVGFAAVFWLNLPKQYFAGRYANYGKERATAEAKSLTLCLVLMALVLVFAAVPFLSLHFPGWLSFLMKYGPVAAGVLQYLAIMPDTRDIERISAIDKLAWDPRSFDSTKRSTPNPSLERELKECSDLLASSDAEAGRRFLTQGSTTVIWSGMAALFRNLENLLGVSAECATLHTDAASALEFALGEVLDARGAQPTVILTSDAEHRSVRAALEKRLQPLYRFRLEICPVQSLLWTNASGQEIVDTLVNACLEKKADVAVLSHVFPDTGVVLDIKELIDAARKQGLRTLFAIDGSQAVGNIMVGDDAFSRSAYYAFHGHGWLLGSPSIGILVRNDWLLRVAGGVPQAVSVPRPFASLRQAGGSDMPPALDGFSPSFALNYVVQQEWLVVGVENATRHSKILAGLFRDEMHRRGVRTIGMSRDSSIVVIADVPQPEAMYHELELKRLDCRMVEATLQSGQRTWGIRFCFHHYHSDEDVRDLAELIGDLNAEAVGAQDRGAEPPVAERSFKQSA
jgi:selenocysteine lyase/cysteine desulfurase